MIHAVRFKRCNIFTSPSKPRSSSIFMESNGRLSSRRLPIPPLRQTLDRYLKSLDPFLRQDEEQGGPPRDVEFSKRAHLAREFEQGLGSVLQERLFALDKVSPYNWLEDNFWMKTAYLQSRDSLIVNSNWWCVYQSDASIPEVAQPARGIYTFWQVRRAAWLLHKMMQYRARLEINAAKRANPLGVPFQMPFYRCRTPGDSCDTIASLPARGSNGSRRIILMLHDWLYAVEVLDNADVALPVAEIEKRLWNTIRDATSRRAQGESPVAIGLLTTHDRRTWCKMRDRLLNISHRNRETLRAIEESIFILSLDDYTLVPEGQSTTIKDAVLDAHVRNASTGISGHNRWYDKCVNIIVESNGRAGGIGEHSPCDGLVVGAMMHHSLSEGVDNGQFEGGSNASSPIDSEGLPGSERLGWDVDEEVRLQCDVAERQAWSISDNSDASMLCFTEFGARWIKDAAKSSPDAFVQMAMQLAWYRDHGDFTATYETATTQMFIHGRTETIRSYTTESRQFVMAMANPQCSAATRLSLLKNAIRVHNTTTRNAIKGQGIDRHLLGLRLVMLEGEDAELFRDPLFERSQTWGLSTSGLFLGEKFLGTGFGAPLEDGYGVQYIIDPDMLKFGVESKRSCQQTSTERFKAALAQSLHDMRNLFEEESSIEPTARL